ncbi:cytochrome P450 [Rhodobacteraceae bacterium NNCM2]|nr:cytochrome P450 [Coraliihabitans acroporae]
MGARTKPPVPPSRRDGQSFLRSWSAARKNIFAALPRRLYRAWLAEARTPWFTSYLANQPDLVRRVLVEKPKAFPKSPLQARVLGDLLGQSVFVTNGAQWERQRRIIDPAFEGGRPRLMFAPMLEAALAASDRLAGRDAPVEVEFEASHAAADVIFRTLFSKPISDRAAEEVFNTFRAYQLAAPMLSVADIIGLPGWVPRIGLRRRRQRREAAKIRAMLANLVTQRAGEIAAGTAPDDLATAIMTTCDPETGTGFGIEEMVDQVGIFFLAGHETSASALAWALYLLAIDPEVQERVHAEARPVFAGETTFADLRRLPFTRDVLRETLRLYPPVPMMIREAREPSEMRDKTIAPGSPVIISPWHLGRHERLWHDPEVFDPDRWQAPETREAARGAHIPFSTGPRVCPGAGFAMQEGVILLGLLASRYRFTPAPGRTPEPMMHLTVRARNGIWLNIERRAEN